METLNELLDESSDFNPILENSNGIFQVSADSEIAWNNIMVESLYIESRIQIMDEDNILLDEAKSNFKDKIVQWIKDKAKKLKEFFRTLKNKIVMAILSVNKFASSNKEYLSEYSGIIKTKGIKAWKSNSTLEGITNDGRNMLKMISDSAESLNNSDINQVYKNIGNDVSGSNSVIIYIKKLYLETDKSSNREIKVTADTFLQEVLDDKFKIASALFNIAETKCNDILKSMMKEAKASGDEPKIIFQKECSSLADSVTGAYVSLILSRMTDAMIISREVIHIVKKSR